MHCYSLSAVSYFCISSHPVASLLSFFHPHNAPPLFFFFTLPFPPFFSDVFFNAVVDFLVKLPCSDFAGWITGPMRWSTFPNLSPCCVPPQMVSLLVIGVAGWGKWFGLVSSFQVMGAMIGVGSFLLVVALVGLIGAVKHHQVLLFFVSFALEWKV